MFVELYQNIKNRRIELNLSQSELASKVGYKDKGSISRIENGSLDLTQSQIVKFAKALECSPAYLMGWEKENIDTKQDIIATLKSIENAIAKSNFSDMTNTEIEIINDIRQLDERGRSIVLRTINEELRYARLSTYAEKLNEVKK